MPVETQFVESTTLFPKDLPSPSASVEHWSPVLQLGAKPDLQAILKEADDLEANAHYEEALQRRLWYHNHALEYEPEAQRGVRLSFALFEWMALGRKYPKARQALLEIRDHNLHAFAEGHGTYTLFKDIAAINERCGYEPSTCDLFKWLKDQQPELAKRCYTVAEDALVSRREYALCLAYVGDGQARFDQHRNNWEQRAQWERTIEQRTQQSQQRMEEYWAQQGRKPPASRPSFRPPSTADNLLANDTRRLIEILVGAGHKADAEKIRGQALALLDHPRIQSALSDAEQKRSR